MPSSTIPSPSGAPDLGVHTDAEILRMFQQTGSREAFAEIVGRYAGPVHGICRRILGDANAAEDAAQEVFLLLSRKAPELKADEGVTGWLFSAAAFVARNARRSEWRRNRHERAAGKEAPVLLQDPEIAWEGVGPQLDEALSELPAAQRDAVVLRHLRGMDHARIASELGCAERTVNTWLARGLETLRENLGRRGVAVTVVLLASLLETKAATAAEPGLVSAVLASAAGPSAGGSAAATTPAIPAAALPFVKIGAVIFAGAAAIALSIPLLKPAPPPPPATAPTPAPALGATPRPVPAPGPKPAAGKIEMARRIAVPANIGLFSNIAFDGKQLLVGAVLPRSRQPGTIHRIDPKDGRILGILDLPAGISTWGSLAFDGAHLWIGQAGWRIAVIDPVSGRIVRTLEGVPPPFAIEPGADGSLWEVRDLIGRPILFRRDPADGRILAQIDLQRPLPKGSHALAVSAGSLWIATPAEKVTATSDHVFGDVHPRSTPPTPARLLRFDVKDGRLLGEWECPVAMPGALAPAGDDALWIADGVTREIRLVSIPAPGK